MAQLKTVVNAVACIVLLICVHAFLLGNKVFEGKFETDAVSWYFLAKGIFCAISLHLSMRLLEVISGISTSR